jgi:nucleoside-diphosphate-sugar epimerase
MKKLLITGTGWLGSRLIEIALESGTEVTCFAQSGTPPLPQRKGLHVFTGDIRKREDCNEFFTLEDGATVIHTAGIIHPRRIRDLYDVNVNGTRNLLDAALDNGVKRFVAVSSNSVCGCNPNRHHRFDENSAPNPYMNYGESKLQMERVIKSFKYSALETVIARGTWFYGPNQPPRQTLFFKMVRDGKFPIVGDGENLRSMSYIDNLCRGLILCALSNKAEGQTYWLADARTYSMNQIVKTVEGLLHYEFGIKCTGKRLHLPNAASTVARVFDRAIQATGFYNQKLHVLSEMNQTIACSIDKAKKELGYDPEINLTEGMRRSIKWCLDNGVKI